METEVTIGHKTIDVYKLMTEKSDKNYFIATAPEDFEEKMIQYWIDESFGATREKVKSWYYDDSFKELNKNLRGNKLLFVEDCDSDCFEVFDTNVPIPMNILKKLDWDNLSLADKIIEAEQVRCNYKAFGGRVVSTFHPHKEAEFNIDRLENEVRRLKLELADRDKKIAELQKL